MPGLRGVESAWQQARIAYPGNGAILALDPDIPPALQRVFFQAEGGRFARFVLDGKIPGSAGHPMAWMPTPGTHTLTLVAAGRGTLDELEFQVRGHAPTHP